MTILKVLEVLSDSHKSWEDATRKAVTEASKSIKNIRSAHVASQSVTVENGKIDRYRVNVKITFEI